MSSCSRERIELGKEGEAIALKFLLDKGYKLIARNYLVSHWGEIDLVMQDSNYLVFVEVRTKRNTIYGTPLETVNHEKRRQIIKMARIYMTKEKVSPDTFCRFDVVGIILPRDGKPQIEYYKDAFILGD